MQERQHFPSNSAFVQLPAGSNTLIVPANQNRRALIISPGDGALIYVGTKSMQAAGLQFGFAMAMATYPLFLLEEEIGTVLYEPWFGRSNAGTNNIGVIDVQWP